MFSLVLVTLILHPSIPLQHLQIATGPAVTEQDKPWNQANKWTSAWSAWTTFSIQHGLTLHTEFHEGCAGLDEVSKLLMDFPAFSKYHKQISAVLCDHSLALQPGGVTWYCKYWTDHLELWSPCKCLGLFSSEPVLDMFFILEASVRSVSSIAGLSPSKCLSDLPGARLGLLEGCCPIQACFCWAVFG